MPWGGGSYTKGNSATGGWTGDASLGIGVEPGRHDAQDNDFALGINQCLNKDGSNAMSGNLNMGGTNKVMNVANGTLATDAVNLGQVQAGINTQSTTLDISNTRFSNDATQAIFRLQKSRGAAVGTNTIVANGDGIGAVYFSAANGTTYTNAAAILATVDGLPGTSNDMPGALRFYTTPDTSGTLTERAIIKSNGNIGIGTSSPTSALQVSGLVDNDPDAAGVHLGVSSVGGYAAVELCEALGGIVDFTSAGVNTRGRIIYTHSTQTLNLSAEATASVSTSGVERLAINASGNLGLGNAAVDPYRFLSKSSTSDSASGAIRAVNSSGAVLLNILGDGTFNTGTAANAPYNNTTASAANLYVSAPGTFFRSTSSIKYKTDVQDATYGLADVLNLRPVTYKGKTDGDTVFGGLIAEEVHDSGLTQFVQYAEDGTPDALAYGNMVALAFKAIQELNAKVEALETRVAALEEA